MRSVLLVFVAMLGGCASAPTAETVVAEEGPHQLEVAMTGLVCCGSAVRVALYNQEAGWLRERSVFKARLAFVSGAEMRLSFYGLPEGRYAIAAFQDLNANTRLDRWLGLLPREPVAFSSVSEWRAPPSFARASFTVPSQQAVEVAF